MATPTMQTPAFAKKFSVCSVVNISCFTFLLINVCDSTVCPSFNAHLMEAVAESSYSPELSSALFNYTCPGDSNPSQHTECCDDPEMKGCCPKKRYFYEIDQSLAQKIMIGVVSACVVLLVVLTTCCFWSKCPLYASCKVEFSAEIPSYDYKDEVVDMDSMPKELSKKGKNVFSPKVVSNGNLSTDAENNAV